jgi:hypothetical protein
MDGLAQDLFGTLIISMQVSLSTDDVTFSGKMVALTRIRCVRRNAEKEFARFAENNPDIRAHATFNFDSDFVA